jgi:Zn-dependent protease
VYWTAWGWKFALGLVLSIYVHEIGHVAALRRYGIKASAPMFIPGVGAVVRLRQYPATPREDARVGLAGPLWGMLAAACTYGLSLLLDWPSWAAIAKVAAWINLFNLLPLWQLDGSRGFHALSRRQRWLVVAILAATWFATTEGLLVLILIVAALRASAGKPTDVEDRTTLTQYALLVVTLAALSCIKVASVP